MQRTTNTLSTPGFLADTYHFRRDTGRQVDWSKVDESYRATPGTAPVDVTLTADAAAGAVALAVDALTGAVPAGTVLRFAADEFATVSAEAAKGDTAVAVEPLVTALETGDTATYAGVAGSGPKVLRAGTVVAFGDDGRAYPAQDGTAAGLLFSDATEPAAAGGSRTDAKTGYGVLRGAHVYENLLPDADPATGELPAAAKAALGSLFTWQTYVDSRLP